MVVGCNLLKDFPMKENIAFFLTPDLLTPVFSTQGIWNEFKDTAGH
jgi:hypothetical protein